MAKSKKERRHERAEKMFYEIEDAVEKNGIANARWDLKYRSTLLENLLRTKFDIFEYKKECDHVCENNNKPHPLCYELCWIEWPYIRLRTIEYRCAHHLSSHNDSRFCSKGIWLEIKKK